MSYLGKKTAVTAWIIAALSYPCVTALSIPGGNCNKLHGK